MRKGNRLREAIAGAVLAAGLSVWIPVAEAADRVQPVPLGGTLKDQSGDRQFGVYVPTRFGGELTVSTSSGKVEALIGPDGKPRSNGGEVGNDQQGWFTFKVTGAKDGYAVDSKFLQIGESTRKPWNFYYWPTKGDSIHEPWAGGNGRVDTMAPAGDDQMIASPGAYIAPGQDIVLPGANGILETQPASGDTSTWFPNLYDDLTWRGPEGQLFQTPSPLLKYDQLFNMSARNWEAANSQNRDIARWPGHCLGGAIASISMNEPNPTPGSGLTRDELKALYAELGENHYNHRIGDHAKEIPPGPPRPGPDETDPFAPRFHAMLETHIRGEKKALLANLRAFPPRGTVNEVWNHGVGKYVSTFEAVPGKGERTVRIKTELTATSGSCLNGNDDKPRVNTYEYRIVYGLDGKVDETNPYMADWISVGGEAIFAPLNVLQVLESQWQGHNPQVTIANVRSVDMANGGGGGGRVAGVAPSFRPVGTYEAGRAPMFAGRNDGSLESPNAPRRGGLFRGIFGR
jgi:hypothetical protein